MMWLYCWVENISYFTQKCIETLIDKQYIERSEGSKDEYTYLAWILKLQEGIQSEIHAVISST